MDRNTVTGLLVIGAIMVGFLLYSGGQNKKLEERRRVADSIAQAEGRLVEQQQLEDFAAEEETGRAVLADSVRRSRIGDMLVDAEGGDGEEMTFSNEVMDLTLSTRGAHVTNVKLNNYSKYGEQGPLTMYEEGTSHFGMQIWLAGNHAINTADYTFGYAGTEEITLPEGGSAQRIVFELPVDSTAAVRYVYTLFEDDYMVDFDVEFEGMEGRLSNQMSRMMLEWGVTVPQQEKGFANENNYSNLAYKNAGDAKVHLVGNRKTGNGSEAVNGNAQWVAMKQQFFTTTLVSRGNLQSPVLSYETFAPESGSLKKFDAKASVVYNRMQNDYGFRFYFGPVEYRQLKSYDLGMERLVTLGWSLVRWVNTGLVIPAFNFLTKHIGSMALIILLLTLMIKIIILPLTWKSYLSMAKMRVLKPELDEIAARYPKQEDAMKKQQATMELYSKAGASPMGGCLPTLIQFPVIVALFYFFPTAIELRGKSFLWAEDLSTYDSILNLPFDIPWYGAHVSLFALLMAASIWLNSRLTSKTQPSGPGAGMMKSMMYLLPIMMLLWFNNYASGLTYYYFLSSLITIVTTWVMQTTVDEKKLHAQMKAVAAKKAASKGGKGKSKWQQRYEDALKQQQQIRQQQQKRK